MRLQTAITALTLFTLLTLTVDARADCAPVGRNPLTAIQSNAGLNCARDSAGRGATVSRVIQPHTSVNNPMDDVRWSAQHIASGRVMAPGPDVGERGADTPFVSPAALSISEVHWADSHDWIHNPPQWIRDAADNAKTYKKRGMPILHLWDSQSRQTVIAIGVNPHGNPGLYFSQKLPF
jgi:hypothetical protein